MVLDISKQNMTGSNITWDSVEILLLKSFRESTKSEDPFAPPEILTQKFDGGAQAYVL